MIAGQYKSVTEIDEVSPTFATTGKQLRIPTKDTIVLPCEVNNLGKELIKTLINFSIYIFPTQRETTM